MALYLPAVPGLSSQGRRVGEGAPTPAPGWSASSSQVQAHGHPRSAAKTAQDGPMVWKGVRGLGLGIRGPGTKCDLSAGPGEGGSGACGQPLWTQARLIMVASGSLPGTTLPRCPLWLPPPPVRAPAEQSVLTAGASPAQGSGLFLGRASSRACSLTPALGTTEPPDGPSFSHLRCSRWARVGGHTCQLLGPTQRSYWSPPVLWLALEKT